MKSTAVFVFLICLPLWGQASNICPIDGKQKYEVVIKEFRSKELVSDFVHPKGCNDPEKIIISFGGSEGGINVRLATRLAKEGYGVYALGYFNVPNTNLPKYLVQVPIEYFEQAIKKIKSFHSPEKCCSLIGGSKGAEAILTLSSLTSMKFENIILISGSDRVMEGLDKNNMPAKKSSWTIKGQDVPYTPLTGLSFMEFIKMAWHWFKLPPKLMPMYLRSIQDPEEGANGLLPVENINSRILFLSGEDDNLWPSTFMGKNLKAQLKSKGHDEIMTHFSFPSVGHAVLSGHHALLKKENRAFLGGSIEASEKADKKAYLKILSVLK